MGEKTEFSEKFVVREEDFPPLLYEIFQLISSDTWRRLGVELSHRSPDAVVDADVIIGGEHAYLGPSRNNVNFSVKVYAGTIHDDAYTGLNNLMGMILKGKMPARVHINDWAAHEYGSGTLAQTKTLVETFLNLGYELVNLEANASLQTPVGYYAYREAAEIRARRSEGLWVSASCEKFPGYGEPPVNHKRIPEPFESILPMIKLLRQRGYLTHWEALLADPTYLSNGDPRFREIAERGALRTISGI